MRQRLQTASTQGETDRTEMHSGPPHPPRTRYAQRLKVLRSEGSAIGIVPLRPAAVDGASTEIPNEPSGESRPSVPGSEAGFDPAKLQSPEAVKVIIAEALRQMGVSGVAISGTKTRRRSSRTVHSMALKAQQTQMSREQDLRWKVRLKFIRFCVSH